MSSPSNLTTPSSNNLTTNVVQPPTTPYGGTLKPASTSGFVDLLDPYKKSSLKQKQRKSQGKCFKKKTIETHSKIKETNLIVLFSKFSQLGSSRYCITSDVELQQLPYLKGKNMQKK